MTPDFITELCSIADNLVKLEQKMSEYSNNSLGVSWLTDSHNQQVEIYRPQQEVELLRAPADLSGENVLPGFVVAQTHILRRVIRTIRRLLSSKKIKLNYLVKVVINIS